MHYHLSRLNMYSYVHNCQHTHKINSSYSNKMQPLAGIEKVSLHNLWMTLQLFSLNNKIYRMVRHWTEEWQLQFVSHFILSQERKKKVICVAHRRLKEPSNRSKKWQNKNFLSYDSFIKRMWTWFTCKVDSSEAWNMTVAEFVWNLFGLRVDFVNFMLNWDLMSKVHTSA